MYSLITTVYNEEKTIQCFINSVNRQTQFPTEFIIVDGGSTDKTVDLIKKHLSSEINYKIILDKTCSKKYSKGPIAKGRNVAIKEANYSNILVTDAGCILDKNWIKEISNSIKNTDIKLVAGWYKALIKNDFQEKVASLFCPDLNSVNPTTFLPSSRSLAFKKEVWEKVAGYPENTYTAEDTLFDLKIFKITKPNERVFNPNAFVYWDVPKSKDELVQKLYQYGYGEGQQRIFMFKNFFRLVLIIFFPILALMVLLGLKKRIVFLFYYYQSKGFLRGLFNS